MRRSEKAKRKPANKATKPKSGSTARKVIKIRLPQLRFKTRLIISFLVPMLAIVILGVSSYTMSKNEITKVTIESSREVINGEIAFFNLLGNIVGSQAMQLLTNTDVRTALKPDFKSLDKPQQIQTTSNINSLLSSLTSANEYVKDYSIIGTNHCIYTNSNLKVRSMEQLKSIPVFDSFMSGNTKKMWIGDTSAISALYGGSALRGASLSYIMQYVDVYTGQLLGVLIIEIDPKVVAGMADRLNAGMGDSHIISQDGYDNALPTDGDSSDPNAGYAFSEEAFYQDFVSGNETLDVIDNNGNLILLGKAENSAVVLSTVIPHSFLNAGANRILIITLIVVSVSVLVSGLIALMISSNLSDAIKKIISAAKAAASGDLRQRISSERADEFGILINSIGQMIESMRKLIIEAADIANSVIESASMVHNSTRQVVKITEDITTAIGEIADGANSQAVDTEAGVEKSNMLASSINVVADNTEQIEQVTNTTFNLTKNALSSMKELDEKAGQTNQIICQIRDDINELSKGGSKISSIVKVITRVADQTSLLSLNASIEAARAGEMGRGFAVVAEEVKLLAEQTAASARDIASIIKEIQVQIETTVNKASSTETIIAEQNDALEKAMQSFSKISDSMDILVDKVQTIKTSTSEMNQHKDQVLNSIQNISAVSQQTAATTQEVTASSDQQMSDLRAFQEKAQILEKEAERLKDAIKVFMV